MKRQNKRRRKRIPVKFQQVILKKIRRVQVAVHLIIARQPAGLARNRLTRIAALMALTALFPVQALGATGAPQAPTQTILTTFLLLFSGVLVMWMAAGFAMLEAGMVRGKNVSMQCLKNVALYATAGLLFWLVGYNLMYLDVNGGLYGVPLPKVLPPIDGDTGRVASGADFFFQMVFCATTASIVSGAMAERVKLWAFVLFTILLTGVLYPVIGAWTWGGGWLNTLGFVDFAGSTIVHATGGWAALVGVLILGARRGRYDKQGRVIPFPGSSMPLATLGTFILWLGWFGFNGGSQLAMGTISDAAAVGRIFVNTNMAAAAGVMTALAFSTLRYGKTDLTITLNGALAGLVSITADPLSPSVLLAIGIGGAGGILLAIAVPVLDRLRIDDVVGAIPVHLVCGVWGTLAVVFSNPEASLLTQLIGIGASGVFVAAAGGAIWIAIDKTIGVRVHEADEYTGLDIAEVGVEAYPEFTAGGQRL